MAQEEGQVKRVWEKPELSFDGELRDALQAGKDSPAPADPGFTSGKSPGQATKDT